MAKGECLASVSIGTKKRIGKIAAIIAMPLFLLTSSLPGEAFGEFGGMLGDVLGGILSIII